MISISIMTIDVYVINLFANDVKPYQWGFSYVGAIFLLMLCIPNIIWSKNVPKNYNEYVKQEKKILVILERVGEVFVTCVALCFKDFNLHITKTSDGIIVPARTYYLILVLLLMILYEMFWIRYFKSEKTMKDFYSSIFGIPLAGATLPVIAAFILGVYGMNLAMVIAVIVLGIGHIGIHYQHYRGLEH